MRKDEGGYIVVETIGSFMLFTFLVLSILTLINIVTVQARVHYALTQTANELSMYSYIIDALGLSDTVKTVDAAGTEVQDQIDSVLSDINTIQGGLAASPSDTTEFMENLNVVMDSVGSLSGTLENVTQDPKGTFHNVLLYGLDKTKNYAMQEIVIRPMLSKYLDNGEVNANEFLKQYNVIESGGERLDLSDSVYINESGDIVIVAEYGIDYAFGLGALPLPEAMRTLTIRQTAKTKAWLGGIDNP
jgi:hypothetical protein